MSTMRREGQFVVDSHGNVDAYFWEMERLFDRIYRLLEEWERSIRVNRTRKKWNPYKIAERDAWLCYLCGDEISKTRHTKNKRNPRGASVDHVIPLCSGGPDTEANIKATHYQCNLRKSYNTW